MVAFGYTDDLKRSSITRMPTRELDAPSAGPSAIMSS